MKSLKLEAMVGQFVTTMAPLAARPAPASTERMSASLSARLADAAFERSEWSEALALYLEALDTGQAVVDIGHCLMRGARSAIYLGEHRAAQALLTSYTDAFPSDAEGLFYLGRAYQGAHRDFDALGCYNAASLIARDKPKYLVAVAQAAHSLAFQGFGYAGDTMPGTYLAIARNALAAALAKEPDHYDSLVEKMLLTLDTGDADGAVALCRSIASKPKVHTPSRITSAVNRLAQALLRGGRSDLVLKLDHLKTFAAGRSLLERAGTTRRPVLVAEKAESVSYLSRAPQTGRWSLETMSSGKLAWPKRGDAVTSAAESVSLACDYVAPIRQTSRGELEGLFARLAALPETFAGLITFATGAAPGRPLLEDIANLVVRKPVWDELAGLNPGAGWDELTAMALARLNLHAVPRTEAPVAPFRAAREGARPRVLVLSRHGPRLFGGVEQFLQIASRHYARSRDVDVFFAGLSKDFSEIARDWPGEGRPFASGFVHEDAASLREFVLRGEIETIHIASGLGELVLEAIAGLNVRLVYGVHFWREFIPARVLSRFYYPDVGMADAKPLPLMEEIVARADYTYVNSDFCADMSRTAYAWSPPVIYSVPVPDTENGGTTPVDPQLGTLPQNFALLANARADKGWLLLLDIAERLPRHDFVAIAGQSDRDAALMDLHRRGIRNVMVLAHTDSMEALYAAARLVLVPSFSFVETFSRVTIEAGRAGRPVLLAESGNLSYLGAGTDLVLPNDPDVWAERVASILNDADAWREAAAQSSAIAARYTAKSLKKNLSRIPIHPDTPRVLVCVGSGIGNICHTTPMIRRLADHVGAPVDVLVSGDFRGSAAVVAGAPSVGQVFEDPKHVLDRRYDVVLVTHCFGNATPNFNTGHLVLSRDLMNFSPGGPLHESAFNLAYLEAAMGIASGERDARAYFFGPLLPQRERPPGPPRIALHAGSKGGIWSAKRWPGFSALAGALIAEGAEVLSVGVAEEYVDGTLDKTGLSIARMAEELSACDALVTNDSGVMNVANAIGVPIVAIFAPTNPATRGPINAPVRILKPETDCTPCEANPRTRGRFESGQCRCISLIGVDQVLAALDELGVRRRVIEESALRRRA